MAKQINIRAQRNNIILTPINMSTYNVKCPESMATLNSHLAKNSFVGGVQPNAQDALTFEQFECCPCGSAYPAVLGWFLLINYFLLY